MTTDHARWPSDAPRDPEDRYRLVYGIGYKVGLRLLKDRAPAEDLAHEVWLTIERFLLRYAAGHGDELRSFERWVQRVATNTALKVYRSKWHQILRLSTPDSDPDAESDAALPDEMAALREYGTRVKDAIKSLSEPISEAFLLHCEGYTYKEIAQRTGSPVGTVKVRVHRARTRLSRILAGGTGETQALS